MKVPMGCMGYAELTCLDDIVNKNPLTVEEVATSQSRICRYGGRGIVPYYDAQHAVLVSYMVPEKHALQALFHDAHEVDTGDMIGPFKREVEAETGVMMAKEDRIQELRLKELGIPWPIHESVKVADKSICVHEMKALAGNGLISIPEIPGFSFHIWTQDECFNEFMERYYELEV